jgi:lipoate-protein ligase A
MDGRLMSMWRLLKHDAHDAFFNMAVDEATLQARIEGKTPNTLRLYRWRPSAVSIGRFQNIQDAVNMEACRIRGVDVVRRVSGGGAVYHDSESEVTYSVIVKREDLGTDDVAEAYRRICNGLIETAHNLGVDVEYNEGNVKQCPNITVKERKISGSAQAHKKGVILQHGTLLLNADLEKMFTLLKVPWADACIDLVSIARRKITSVAEESGRPVPIDLAYQAAAEGFERALNMKLVEAELSEYESGLARRLEKEKFSTREWNFEGKARPLSLKPVS